MLLLNIYSNETNKQISVYIIVFSLVFVQRNLPELTFPVT